MTIAMILESKGRDVFSLRGDVSVAEAVKLLAERRIGAALVMDGDTIAGVFSERDLVYCVGHKGAAALERPVSEVMTSPAITVAPGQPALAALSLMTRRRIRHLPVVESGSLVGMVSIGDLVKYRIERIEAEAAAMRDYIQSV